MRDDPVPFCDGISSVFHGMVLVIICVRLHAPTLFFLIDFLANSQKHVLTNETYHATEYDGPYIGTGEEKMTWCTLAACQHTPRLCSYLIVKIQSLYILIA